MCQLQQFEVKMRKGSSTREVSDSISHKLSQLSATQSKFCIYRMHTHLRSVNERAYEPEIVVIGPYHRNKDNLKMMEDLKRQFLHLLIQEREQNKKKFTSVIGELEEAARRCYAEPLTDVSTAEFAEMVVLDGCFIRSLVRKYSMESLRNKNDHIFQTGWMVNSLQRDLMLFENQIPFFIFRKLFGLIEVPNQDDRLIFLLLKYFSNLYPGKGYRLSINTNLDEIKDLLDLIHINWLPPHVCFNIDHQDQKDERKKWQAIQSATKLKEANVKFERSPSNSLFEIELKNGVMSLPPVTINDRTGSFFQNLIAHEQYSRDTKVSYVMDYIKFMHCLVHSSEDVEILCPCGIIDSWLGNDEAVENIFNKLSASVTVPGKHFMYAKVLDGVNFHCNTCRNRLMANLKHNYLQSPWVNSTAICAEIG